MVVFGQTCFIGVGLMNSGNLVVFGQKWLYSGKSGCNRAKVVVFWQSVSYLAKWLYSGNVVVIGQSGCVLAKWLYSRKVVAFAQKWL